MLSKERQLELYLNLVEWGEGVWGVAAASAFHFGRPPGDLAPTEMVMLANVLPAPGRGLSFPLSPPRRAKLRLIVNILWQEDILDDLAASAATARLERMGSFVDAGMDPHEAAAATALEMGAEPALTHAAATAERPWADRCDPARRG